MHDNYVFPSIVEALPVMLNNIERDGQVVESRVGTTKELTHIGITLAEPWNREILVGHRKPNLAAQIAETMWVLAGRDDIAWLENYLPRVRDFSDDGETWRAGYGARLRRWGSVDQWRFIVEHLTEQPESRRAVMSIWDPAIDTEPGKDIPCNDWLSFLGRDGRLDLHVAIRSNDVIWGWSGINQFEWSALLEITAAMTGMETGNLHFSTTSFHLYDHHFEKAEKIRTSDLPDLHGVNDSPRFDAAAVYRDFGTLDRLFERWFQIENDIREGSLLVQHYVDTFPEPMLQSWLRILQWWWGKGDTSYLKPLAGTRLYWATDFSVKPKKPDAGITIGPSGIFSPGPGRIFQIPVPFIEQVCSLHVSKDAAYGPSWKKRGEAFSIIPNIARKIDRLGNGETDDETQADTSQDLMVYLAKYLVWLQEQDLSEGPLPSDSPEAANDILRGLDSRLGFEPQPSFSRPEAIATLEEDLQSQFETLLQMVDDKYPHRVEWVQGMLEDAYRLAYNRWADLDGYAGADVD